jgi:16S rRNA (adenine1518-N6/adenine1519-N6)-dimethyltransferase
MHKSEVKELFKEHGLAPKKWMGQNLLVDKNHLRKIVDAAEVSAGDKIVEIGAGLGILTEALADKGAEVWALELDSGFFRVLEEKFADRPEIRLIHADALKYDFTELAGEIGPLRVVANLPYNVSSRLIFRFFEHRNLFSELIILLQKEVAERLVARPGTKDYGILTVLLAVSSRIERLFNIPAQAFYPVPEIVSTLIKIGFSSDLAEITDQELFIRLVKAAFAGRRKTLKNTLRPSNTEIADEIIAEAAKRADIDLKLRGEALTPRDFVRFSNAVSVGAAASHNRIGLTSLAEE